MAEMKIHLRRDPETGKQNIIVVLEGEADMLPHEHEQLHRRLVDKLLEGGLLANGEAGKLIIEREEKHEPAVPEKSGPEAERQAVSEGQ